jgi:two-component system cell cycle response regulator DivK
LQKLLLIEDEENNIYLLRYLLEQDGFDVAVGRTGTEGMMLAAENAYDVILMDIQLPDASGFDLTLQLRDRVRTRNTPIIAVTSLAMAGDRARALEAGCTGYIEKPIDPKTFAERVRDIVDGSVRD